MKKNEFTKFQKGSKLSNVFSFWYVSLNAKDYEMGSSLAPQAGEKKVVSDGPRKDCYSVSKS